MPPRSWSHRPSPGPSPGSTGAPRRSRDDALLTFVEQPTRAISVVVPVYNSRESLGALVERVAAALEGLDYELVLVNDGSRDGSWEQIELLSRDEPRVHGIDLMRNYGQHNA